MVNKGSKAKLINQNQEKNVGLFYSCYAVFSKAGKADAVSAGDTSTCATGLHVEIKKQELCMEIFYT